jgi:exodeoxyribonuclease V alpha subunit
VAGELCGIVGNANRIVTNRYNILELIPTSNFTVMEGGVPRVVDIIKACKGGSVPARDIVVLSPFNRPLPELNAWFQEIYNPDGVAVIDSRKRTWKVNDLVMLTENLAEDSVYNGDIGVITAVDPLKVTVDFDAKPGLEFLLEPTISEREYRTDEEEEFRVLEKTVKLLASGHALTVDKSQGSEWQFVVVYIDAFTASSFLNRRRIYTAITRAKRAVWLVVADVEALQVSAAKNLPYRHENLPKRLKAVLPPIPPYKPAAPVTSLQMEDDDEGWEEDPAWAD